MTTVDFEELCELSYARVAKAAYLILGDRQEALDVAQETFSRALERWAEVGSMENPQGWPYRVLFRLYPPCAGVTRPPPLFRDGATRVVAVASGPVPQLRVAERSRLIPLRLSADRTRSTSSKRRIVDRRLIRGRHVDTMPACPEVETRSHRG